MARAQAALEDSAEDVKERGPGRSLRQNRKLRPRALYGESRKNRSCRTLIYDVKQPVGYDPLFGDGAVPRDDARTQAAFLATGMLMSGWDIWTSRCRLTSSKVWPVDSSVAFLPPNLCQRSMAIVQ